MMSSSVKFNTEREESLNSLEKRSELKSREFREYLVDKNVVLAMVKFLLSLKNSAYRPENPFEVMKEYFGIYKSEAMEEYDALRVACEELEKDNEHLANEIETLRNKIEEARESKRRREELEAQAKAEEEAKKAKKNTKK
eukprot:TRINITY_DN2313_c0_g1_i4.p1 TRINITY_DN2313_c0_g1~~TRINITY_DN2313_c0_g1_i4.p1  ORF type:complete len:140 (-),score=49.58 TRINITY_DN2313_c0_g1_i4:39-458(-)